MIQETIRSKFRDSTVLTIAHRLHTIMDSDRIMVCVTRHLSNFVLAQRKYSATCSKSPCCFQVLSDGRIVEFEAPYLLLQKKESYFSQMVEQTGKQEAGRLFGIAREAHLGRSEVGSGTEAKFQ